MRLGGDLELEIKVGTGSTGTGDNTDNSIFVDDENMKKSTTEYTIETGTNSILLGADHRLSAGAD